MVKYDGYFIIDNKKYCYLVVDNTKSEIVMKDGIEKCTRYFNVYDGDDRIIDNFAIYDTCENLHNITPEYVKRKFIEKTRVDL